MIDVLSPVPVTTLYRATRRPALVYVPEMRFAGISGRGAPAGPEFRLAIGALYSIAYGVRFALRARGVDEKVSPLESQWWTEDVVGDFGAALDRGGFSEADKAAWSWRALIRLPDAADPRLCSEVRQQAIRRHAELAAAIERVEVAPWREGLAAQVLHVGPYSTELATVQRLHEFIGVAGYRPVGRHHEIYLGDPRRCAPERLRTVLRQPVAPA